MKTKVVLTVDTEPSIAGAFLDPAANRPLIHEPVAGEVGGKSEALGFLIETLRGHGLTATFFVETAHTAYFPAALMGPLRRGPARGRPGRPAAPAPQLAFLRGRPVRAPQQSQR